MSEELKEHAEMDLVAKNWRDLVRPRTVEPSIKNTDVYGKFVVRPLERGYGVTVGNSLRRILLSSLSGAAITSIRLKESSMSSLLFLVSLRMLQRLY